MTPNAHSASCHAGTMGVSTSDGRRAQLLTVELAPHTVAGFTTCGQEATANISLPTPGLAGLNLAGHVHDLPERVTIARRGLETSCDLGEASLRWMRQIHSSTVATACMDDEPEADALILDTTDPRCVGVRGIGVLVADCVPVLLASDDGHIVAAVHAGRRGMVGRIVPKVLGHMRARGVWPEKVRAAVGPSICGSCYEVSEEIYEECTLAVPASASRTRSGAPALDIAAGVMAQLKQAGVRVIEQVQACTLEDERFYSYRRDKQCGRFAGIIMLTTHLPS